MIPQYSLRITATHLIVCKSLRQRMLHFSYDCDEHCIYDMQNIFVVDCVQAVAENKPKASYTLQ
jgi:hypothetical protein